MQREINNLIAERVGKIEAITKSALAGNLQVLQEAIKNIGGSLSNVTENMTSFARLQEKLGDAFDTSLNSSDKNYIKISEEVYNFISKLPFKDSIISNERLLKYKVLHSKINLKEASEDQNYKRDLDKIVNYERNNHQSVSLLHLAARSMNIGNIKFLVEELDYDPDLYKTPYNNESPIFFMLDNLSIFLDKNENLDIPEYNDFFNCFKYLVFRSSQDELFYHSIPRILGDVEVSKYNLIQWLVFYNDKKAIGFLIDEMGIDLLDTRLTINGANLINIIFSNNDNLEQIDLDFIEFLFDKGLDLRGDCYYEDAKLYASATLKIFIDHFNSGGSDKFKYNDLDSDKKKLFSKCLSYLIQKGASLNNLEINKDNYQLFIDAFADKTYVKDVLDLICLKPLSNDGRSVINFRLEFYKKLFDEILPNHHYKIFKNFQEINEFRSNRRVSRSSLEDISNNDKIDEEISILKLHLFCQRNRNIAKFIENNQQSLGNEINDEIIFKFTEDLIKKFSDNFLKLAIGEEFVKIDKNLFHIIEFSKTLTSSYKNKNRNRSCEDFIKINKLITNNLNDISSKISELQDLKIHNLSNAIKVADEIVKSFQDFKIGCVFFDNLLSNSESKEIENSVKNLSQILNDKKFNLAIKDIMDKVDEANDIKSLVEKIKNSRTGLFSIEIKKKIDQEFAQRLKNILNRIDNVESLKEFFEEKQQLNPNINEEVNSYFTNNNLRIINNSIKIDDAFNKIDLDMINSASKVIFDNFPNCVDGIKDFFKDGLISKMISLVDQDFLDSQTLKNTVEIDDFIKSATSKIFTNQIIDQQKTELIIKFVDSFGLSIINNIKNLDGSEHNKKDQLISKLSSYIYFFAKYSKSIACHLKDDSVYRRILRDFDKVFDNDNEKYDFQMNLVQKFRSLKLNEIKEELCSIEKFPNINIDLYNSLNDSARNNYFFGILYSGHLKSFKERLRKRDHRQVDPEQYSGYDSSFSSSSDQFSRPSSGLSFEGSISSSENPYTSSDRESSQAPSEQSFSQANRSYHREGSSTSQLSENTREGIETLQGMQHGRLRPSYAENLMGRSRDNSFNTQRHL